MRSFEDHSGSTPLPHGDPVRWANAAPESLGAASRLLVSPPPIMALPSDVAMRVRNNVLRAPSPSASPTESASILARNASALKLGGIAIGAALFGAGAMTALSAVQDPSELRVVVAPTPQPTSTSETRSFGVRVLEPDTTERAGSFAEVPRETDALARGLARAQDPTLADTALADSLRPNAASNAQPSADATLATAAHLGHTSNGAEDGTNRVTPQTLASRKPTDLPGEPGRNQQGRLDALSVQSSPGTQPGEADGSTVVVAANAQPSPSGDHELELLAETDTIERPVVRPQFRRVTAARKITPRVTLSSLEEETRLLEDARSKLGRAPETALTLAFEHQTRFRHGQLLEQRRMIHLEALLRLGRDDEAKKLASSIGSSIYQARANALLVRYGIVIE